MTVLEHCPGYAEAVLAERLSRTAAFLIDAETVGPFSVQPFRFRHYQILLLAGNPLVTEGTPSDDQLAQFLWLISPGYGHSRTFRRWRFLRRCRLMFCLPFPPLLKSNRALKRWEAECNRKLKVAQTLIGAARTYVDDALMDLAGGTGKYRRQYYSDIAAVCGSMARAFNGMFSEEEILEMPMKKLLQYLNDAKRADDPQCPLYNRSDDIANAWIKERNRLKKN